MVNSTKAKPKMKQEEILRKCPVDGRMFAVYPKKKNYHHHHGVQPSYKRPSTAVTCSRVCSRIFIRSRRKYLKNKQTS